MVEEKHKEMCERVKDREREQDGERGTERQRDRQILHLRKKASVKDVVLHYVILLYKIY